MLFKLSLVKSISLLQLLGIGMISAQTDPRVSDSTDSGWKRQFNGLLNLSQAYQDHWVKGGTDALAWEINLNGSAVLDRKDFIWESKAKATYGRTKIQAMASRKSTDEWSLESIYTRKFGAWVNPFAAASGQSQFSLGYSYDDAVATRVAKSDFFDPAFFMETLGLGITPIKDLSERLGATMKQTVSDRYGYADDKDTKGEKESFKQEYGLTSSTEYKFALMQNILATTRLDIFANFKGIEEIDRHWDNRVTATVNKWVNVNVAFELLHDEDLSSYTQMREALSVGISFLSL
jgi:hypothetical protein